MERAEHLWPGGPRYIYDEQCFPPSTDSFLLGSFAAPRRDERVCDLGAGAGLLGLLLLAREPSLSVTGIERDTHTCAMLARNAAANGLPLTPLCADLRQQDALPAGAFQLAVSNPPYFAPHTGAVAEGVRGDARAELTASLDDVFAAAERLLQWGGRFCLVYRPERLAALMAAAAAHGLEPKRLRLVQHTAQSAPSLLLLECRRGGKPGLSVEPPLLLHLPDGGESPDVRRAYFRDKE